MASPLTPLPQIIVVGSPDDVSAEPQDDLWAQLWREAEHAAAQRNTPPRALRAPDPPEQTQRVRYAYD